MSKRKRRTGVSSNSHLCTCQRKSANFVDCIKCGKIRRFAVASAQMRVLGGGDAHPYTAVARVCAPTQVSSNPRVTYSVSDRRGTAADRLSRDQVLLQTTMKIDASPTWPTSLPIYYSDFSSIIINSIGARNFSYKLEKRIARAS